jgi:hypothetical protein
MKAFFEHQTGLEHSRIVPGHADFTTDVLTARLRADSTDQCAHARERSDGADAAEHGVVRRVRPSRQVPTRVAHRPTHGEHRIGGAEPGRRGQRLHEVLLAELQGAGKLDWSRAVIDSSQCARRQTRPKSGPIPVNRAAQVRSTTF